MLCHLFPRRRVVGGGGTAMATVSRRDFVKQAAVVGATAQLMTAVGDAALAAAPASTASIDVTPACEGVAVRWLDDAPRHPMGATWGVPWPRGKWRAEQ